MTTTRKVNQLTNLGNIADGDVLVGERTSGTTVTLTMTGVTKLAGIESGATADQTAAEIKTAYESNLDTNAFTDAEQTKVANLSGTNTGDQTISLTGDVTGSGTGSFVATIANSAVTLAKQADMATASVVYRKTAGTGVPEVNSLATLKTDLGLTGTNSGDQTISLTGDVTGSGTGSFAATIASQAVTYAKMQNVSATARIMGRDTAGAGSMEELTASTVKTMLSLNNVENTALSTWAGTANITILGTITTGTWTASVHGVAYGGTGLSSVTAYAPIVGGTTSTGALQSIAAGSTGQMLQSGGASAVPTWSTPTYPSTSATAGKHIRSDGTNWAAGGVTWLNTAAKGDVLICTATNAIDSLVPGTSGQLLQTSGAGFVPAWTTATYPATAGTVGKVMQSDGTNWTSATPTGTGAPVLATTPTLVTPVLGAATATSINFGQTTLNYYETGTFTPTFTFATPGNLSVVYTVQEGAYTRIGNAVYINYVLIWTPTFTTASGNARFSGLPFTLNGVSCPLNTGNKSANVTFNAGDTMCVALAVGSTAYIQVRTYSTSTANSDLTTARFTSGASHTLVIAGVITV